MNYKKTFNKMKKLIGTKKIINSIHKSLQFTDEPKFFQYTAFMNNYSKKTSAPFDKEECYGSGLDINEDLAKIKTIGECIERYCLAIFQNKNFIKEKYTKLSKETNILNILDLINFTNKPEEYFSKIKNKKINWSEGYDFLKNRKVLIPSQLIYVPYYAKEPTIRLPLSSGAACAESKKEAIYKGICELIERDSFMIYYLNKISPEKINLNSIKNKEINEMISRFKKYFLEVHLLNITTNLKVPSILCILIDRTGVGPAISIGAKSDLNIYKAIRGSILEAQHGRTWIRCKMIMGEKIKSSKEIKSPEDRALYWANKKQIQKLDYMINSKKTISIKKVKSKKSNINSNFKDIIKIIEDKKYNIYYKDITTKKIEDAGFKVIKTIIPQLHPLFLFEECKYLYSERLKKVPIELGHNKKLNKEVHPFV